MERVLHGVVHGNTIEITGDVGLLDGAEVVVTVRPSNPSKNWGEGIRNSAGGWADYPEMDAIMEQIQRDRKRERRPQVSP